MNNPLDIIAAYQQEKGWNPTRTFGQFTQRSNWRIPMSFVREYPASELARAFNDESLARVAQEIQKSAPPVLDFERRVLVCKEWERVYSEFCCKKRDACTTTFYVRSCDVYETPLLMYRVTTTDEDVFFLCAYQPEWDQILKPFTTAKGQPMRVTFLESENHQFILNGEVL